MIDFFLAPKTKNIASPHFPPDLLYNLIVMMKPKKKTLLIIKPQYSIINSWKQSRCLTDNQCSFVHLEPIPTSPPGSFLKYSAKIILFTFAVFVLFTFSSLCQFFLIAPSSAASYAQLMPLVVK